MVGSYKDLRAWKLSMEMAMEIYRQTESFPREERYGLTSPLRRAAVSVSSNIAEGKGRSSDKELYFSYTMPEAHSLKSRPSCSSLKD